MNYHLILLNFINITIDFFIFCVIFTLDTFRTFYLIFIYMKPLYTEEEFENAKSFDKLPLECCVCKKTFFSEKRIIKRALGLNKSPGKKHSSKYCSAKCFGKSKIKEQKVTCKNCNTGNHFCSSSCSATFTNKGKKHSEETKRKMSEAQRKIYPSSRIFHSKCDICGKITITRYKKKYCRFCYDNRRSYGYACRFSFNVYKFPEKFNLKLIEKHGWYSTPGSRKGIKNTNGISRDHKLSISYGWENNINPNILSHPANCVLIRHLENQKKNTKSSITLKELKNLIKKWKIEHAR